ncbi:ABC transporter permease [Brooklawnia cerclae]|uniref:Transport permease protein n=1 Tax=Brooklawnia cerclae TaxID=349934 RepID=A0ABX0SGC8_9ACTN|nr:ABC transporter permease [Brooklawnia cerclae]NIH57031.1 ABC-2 type transport system permease protein [Brooklawnia cerclae]
MTALVQAQPVLFPTMLKKRIGLRDTVSQTATMAYRALLRLRRTPEQWVDILLMPFIFTFMFAFLFGGAIAGSVSDYLPSLIPAIIVQSVVQASVLTGTQLREDMDTGVFDRFRSLPIARIAPLAGPLLTDTIRYAIITGLTMLVGFLIGWRPGGGWGLLVGALLVIVVTWAVSWIWALLGVTARTTGTVQGVAMLVMMPMTFFSNAFVPTSTLPDWLRPIADWNPLSHLITALRALINDGVWGTEAWWTLLGAAIIVAVFAPLTTRAYMRKA